MAACKCYVAMLKMDDHLHIVNIEERRVEIEHTEDLEEVSLDDNIPGQTIHIGTQAGSSVYRELALFLKSN